jgi:hypothetical protein
MQRTTLVSALVVSSFFVFAGVLGSCAARRAAASPQWTTKAARLDAIRRAQVWAPRNIPSMDLKQGPPGPGAFTPGQTITCDYVEREMSGRSPKFTCVIPGPQPDALKVKYGLDNAEVYGEMLTTRLLWALGFGADRMYSVRVVCRGCPARIKAEQVLPSGDRVFDPAVVERKMTGREIGTKGDEGWSWKELDLVDPEAGGAPQAHRDALKLLAVMVQHSDSKPSQQRLICLDADADSGNGGQSECRRPFMLMQDVGLTFGKTDMFYRKVNYANLARWSGVEVFAERAGCVGNLYKPFLGTLEMPPISEGGRQFLAGLLEQLSDAQIHDLFDAARVTLRPTAAGQDRRTGLTTVEWVAAFKQKRQEIASRRCSTVEPLLPARR